MDCVERWEVLAEEAFIACEEAVCAELGVGGDEEVGEDAGA